MFFEAPRNELESKGCEACHGAGREHVEAARAHDVAREKGVTYQGPRSSDFIIRLGKDAPLSTQEQNARCLQCHERARGLFWKGSGHEARGLACVTCHQVHQKAPPAVAAARFKEPLTSGHAFPEAHSNGSLLRVPSDAPGAAPALLAHAAAGGRDDLRELP